MINYYHEAKPLTGVNYCCQADPRFVFHIYFSPLLSAFILDLWNIPNRSGFDVCIVKPFPE